MPRGTAVLVVGTVGDNGIWKVKFCPDALFGLAALIDNNNNNKDYKYFDSWI